MRVGLIVQGECDGVEDVVVVKMCYRGKVSSVH